VKVHALLLEGSAQRCEARKGLRPCLRKLGIAMGVRCGASDWDFPCSELHEKNTVLLCYRCTLTNLGGLAARFVKFEGVV
jgi:hypothetical protein